MKVQRVEIITVNYNTPDLTSQLYRSIRKNISKTVKIRVIDGSDIHSSHLTLLARQDDNLTINKFDYNIHHGRGMDHAIRTSKFKYVLILDSDGIVTAKGILKAMFNHLESDSYAVGEIVYIDSKGGNTIQSKGIPYVHPRCMLINCREYIKYKKFELHGAPCIYAMWDISEKGDAHKLKKFHEIGNYFKELGRGTVSRFGYGVRDRARRRKPKKFQPVMFNILVRTSGRPNYFKNCINSIYIQNYRYYNLIVSCDDDESEKYVREMGVDNIIRVTRVEKSGRRFFDNVGRWRNSAPYNLYLNKLMEQCVPGYIIYLDDDDAFVNNNSLKTIQEAIKGKDQVLFWRVLFPNGRLIPTDDAWGKEPRCCDISGIGYSFHTNYMCYAQWDAYNLCDYVIAKRLFWQVPEKTYINQPLTKIQRKVANGLGRRDDI